ncbi:MAG TPA: adenylyl-sulfate kinase, partial [Vicinamibacterales bacterium]|nr:adenylyl-sulfate kinase [Vicinamibacterales bacterium]
AASPRLAWYRGPTVLETLDTFPGPRAQEHQPFRMPVQDVYKFTARGDDRRIVSGTVESGRARVGDDVVFYPSGKRSTIKSIEAFNRPPATTMSAGEAVGFTLREQIYVARGELAAIRDEPRPHLTSRLKVSLFWLGRRPLERAKSYVLKIGTARATMRVEEVHRVIDASDLTSAEGRERIERHEVAECTLACNRGVAFDAGEATAATSRFVIVDDYEISGGGIIREALPDRQDLARERVLLREYKWEASFIAPERRAARFAQRPTLLIVTGPKETDRKGLAKLLEARLFDEGRVAYFLGIGNVVYGIDADLARDREHRREHIRRLGEVANLMLDAGMILIVSAQALSPEELDLIRTTVDSGRIATVWIGDHAAADPHCDLLLSDLAGEDANVEHIRALLRDKHVLFQPW